MGDKKAVLFWTGLNAKPFLWGFDFFEYFTAGGDFDSVSDSSPRLPSVLDTTRSSGIFVFTTLEDKFLTC